jgi:hypothetical protein
VLRSKGAGYEGPLQTRRRALAERFCFWRGASGRRYVCSVFSPGAVPPYSPSVAVHVCSGPLGPRVVGVTAGGDVEPLPGADEVHLHLVRGGREALAQALRDLGALVATATVIELRAA